MTTYYHLPLDVRPKTDCGACDGKGVTGEQFEEPADNGIVLIIDVMCPLCAPQQGRNDFLSFEDIPEEDEPDFDLDGQDRDEDEPEPGSCPSCGGKKWNANQAFDDERLYILIAPCGCAEKLMVDITASYTP